MPAKREYYTFMASDLTERQIFNLEKALRVLKIPYTKELVVEPAKFNPISGVYE